jgi:lipopolysaccharide/colanic/teichoic acid biosynthesis glycosyltransferase
LNGVSDHFPRPSGPSEAGPDLRQASDRADGDLEVQKARDTLYIVRNWSLCLDLYILARTARAVLFPKCAY